MLEIIQFLYFNFPILIVFTDGRGMRHKYFKDYKDYLGKWGNEEILETCTVTSLKAPICMMSQ